MTLYYGALNKKVVTRGCTSLDELRVEIQNHHVFDLDKGGTDDERQYRIITVSEYDMYDFGTNAFNPSLSGEKMCKLEKVITSRRTTSVELASSPLEAADGMIDGQKYPAKAA